MSGVVAETGRGSPARPSGPGRDRARRGDGLAAAEALQVCRGALPSVSRTFALAIRVLPDPLRDPVTIAYLLCRLADVLEDATGCDPAVRIEGLELLAEGLASGSASPEDLAAALAHAESLPLPDDAGSRLLRCRGAVFCAYASLPGETREVISRWVQAMALGMASFVDRERRAREGAGPVRVVLDTREEMQRYAYYVAGTVGHLLTELFLLHLGPGAVDPARLRGLAVPFGAGLQYTNILQDLAEDRRRGWSYLPEELARAHGTSVQAFEDPAERPRVLRVIGSVVQEAAACLDRAMEYTLALPRRTPRLRLFCAWPIFFALRTLVRIWGEEQVLLGAERIRITRPEVRLVMGMTSASCLSNRGLHHLWVREKKRLGERMIAKPV
jgi:farnesyl-diphosphate farnesyltransferase